MGPGTGLGGFPQAPMIDQDRELKLPEVEHFSQAEDRPCSVEVRQHHP